MKLLIYFRYVFFSLTSLSFNSKNYIAIKYYISDFQFLIFSLSFCLNVFQSCLYAFIIFFLKFSYFFVIEVNVQYYTPQSSSPVLSNSEQTVSKRKKKEKTSTTFCGGMLLCSFIIVLIFFIYILF